MSIVLASLSQLKHKVLTSIHSRKLGLDHQGFLVGHLGARLPYEDVASASTLANVGVSVLTGSTAAFTLNAPPVRGAQKIIINGSSVSTATMSVVRSGSGVTFAGSTANGGGGVKIDLLNNGAAVHLLALSTALWAMIGTATFGSTPYVTVSTSS